MDNQTSKPQITSTATMQIVGELTAGALLQFAGAVPADAKVTVGVQRGGQLDPRLTTITATWNGGAPAQGGQLPHSNIPGARG